MPRAEFIGLVAVLLALACAPAGNAGTALRNPAPGSYVSQQGRANLKAEPGQGGVQISIDATGANLHTCFLDGLAKGGVLEPHGEPGLEAVEGGPAGADGVCRVEFRPFAGGVEVDAGEECHVYCGARAWFPGTYLKVPEACQPEASKRSQESFDILYKAGQFAEAYAVLEPQLDRCGPFLHLYASSSIRNDLAMTLLHLDRKADCRAMLAPLLDVFTRDEDLLRQRWGPMESDDILALARTTWRNDALCGGPAWPEADSDE